MYEPTKPLVILYPGGVVEYLSKPLTITEDISCLEGGYIVMQTVQGRRQIRVNLPKIDFAVSAVNLAIMMHRSKLLYMLAHPSPKIRIYH